jgi:two-component system, NarL family, response regulator DesR
MTQLSGGTGGTGGAGGAGGAGGIGGADGLTSNRPTASGERDVIRVLLADDQALVRGALVALLGLEPDLQVVAEVGRGDEVVEAARRSRPDVVLMDVEMPGIDGIIATAALRAALPSCRVLVVTTFGRPGYLQRAMEAGASGFVVKDTPARQLADAVRRAHRGLRVVDPMLAAETLAVGANPLSARENQVLTSSRAGGTVADIAAELHLSEGTVRNHLSAAIGKTGARTRAEAVRIAEQNGWLPA